jgi:type II secretory pathway pseudopilin PulG
MKSRPFTVLEIVIVLALIALVAGLGIGSINSLLEKHRFQAEIDRFKEMIQELQIEALALRSDIEIELKKSEEGWIAQSKTAESILRPETLELKRVTEITLNGATQDHYRLNIFSTGRIEPSALIEMKAGEEVLWIDLRRPIQIAFSAERPADLTPVKIPEKPKELHGPQKPSL